MASLYRKFRPLTFKDVIGQEHITTTLINQINSGRIGHAYLFTGSRGVGKTTCARIFARAVNCMNNENGSPCGNCEVCKALSTSSNLDIIEIDAASNNGVDDAREIRENVKYPPVTGKYKIYIIDEAHMLTGSAFNALLKTLEEPPPHAIFILATTEAHKLPATILSRCMRFDFRLVSKKEIESLIKSIYDEEGKKYDDEGISFIASLAEGSVRDGLSIADVCMGAGETISYQNVLTLLGGTDKKNIRTLFTAIADGMHASALREINSLATSGKSMNLIAKELSSYARDVMLQMTAPELVDGTQEYIACLGHDAEKYNINLIATIISIFSSVDTELRYSVSPRIVLELAALRACKLMQTDLTALEARIERLEKRPSAVVSDSSSNVVSPENEGMPPLSAKAVWGKVITYMRENESVALRDLVTNHSDYELKNGIFTIWANKDNFLEFCDEETLEKLRQAFIFCGINYKLKVDKRDEPDLDSEIERLKKMVGKDVNINIKK